MIELLACLVPIAFMLVVLRYRTALMGLSLLNAFYVASASMSAFLFGSLTGLPLDWFTNAHAEVVLYSVAGCLAMAFGLLLSWRSLSRIRTRSIRNNCPYPP